MLYFQYNDTKYFFYQQWEVFIKNFHSVGIIFIFRQTAKQNDKKEGVWGRNFYHFAAKIRVRTDRDV